MDTHTSCVGQRHAFGTASTSLQSVMVAPDTSANASHSFYEYFHWENIFRCTGNKVHTHLGTEDHQGISCCSAGTPMRHKATSCPEPRTGRRSQLLKRMTCLFAVSCHTRVTPWLCQLSHFCLCRGTPKPQHLFPGSPCCGPSALFGPTWEPWDQTCVLIPDHHESCHQQSSVLKRAFSAIPGPNSSMLS